MELLQHLLTRAARATPQAHVIESPSGAMTYGELDARSNQLARLLIALGAGRGVPVALCLEKGPLALAAIFGVLKSGACYVPLDAAAPASRAGRILTDAGPVAVLADERGAPVVTAALEDLAPAPAMIRIDVPAPPPTDSGLTWADAARHGDGPLDDRQLSDEDPAYILYTSGSTGAPKGVALSHLAAMTFVGCSQAAFALTAQDRVSSHAPLHFDLSIFDVYVTIAAGATIVPITGPALVFPRTLARMIDEERISVWYSVPFALVQLIQHGGLERFPFDRLRTVLFAGEPLAVSHLRTLMDHWPAARFFNLYGPTETNVVTWQEISRPDAEGLEELPIGTPWPGTEIRILGTDLRDAPAGEAGELCVRGRTTMSGYWGAQEESARSFVSLRVHARLPPVSFYRTGDIVRADADGVLWFLGRRDELVKIRGHRVELGEVEAVLRGHPGLAEVAAVAVPHDELGLELVAAATPLHEHAAPDGREILAFCASHLPPYMQPGRVEVLASLPRTSTGKLDRQRLARELPASTDHTGARWPLIRSRA